MCNRSGKDARLVKPVLVLDADIAHTGQRGRPWEQSPHLGGRRVQFRVRRRHRKRRPGPSKVGVFLGEGP